MKENPVVEWIRNKYSNLRGSLDERGRRVWGAVEAMSLGWGGVVAVSQATGIAESTIRRGVQELKADNSSSQDRQRRKGGGRKKAEERDVKIVRALDRLVDPATLGDPQSPLRWTTKSTRNLAAELTKQNHPSGARPSSAAARVGIQSAGESKDSGGSKIQTATPSFDTLTVE